MRQLQNSRFGLVSTAGGIGLRNCQPADRVLWDDPGELLQHLIRKPSAPYWNRFESSGLLDRACCAGPPERPGELRVPSFPGVHELPVLVGMLCHQVVGLTGVLHQVVEARRSHLHLRGQRRHVGVIGGLIVPDEFPIAAADRPLFAQPPVEALVGRVPSSRPSGPAGGSRRRAANPPGMRHRPRPGRWEERRAGSRADRRRGPPGVSPSIAPRMGRGCPLPAWSAWNRGRGRSGKH